MYTFFNQDTIDETLLNHTKLLFNRAGWAGALSLLFPDDPGSEVRGTPERGCRRLPPPQPSRSGEVGITLQAARPWPRPGTIALCLEPRVPMKLRNRIIFPCRRARAGRLYLQLYPPGGISEHNSMGFFGVKKRHPYPWYQSSFGAKAIIQ